DSAAIPSLEHLARVAARGDDRPSRWEAVLVWTAQLALAAMLITGGTAMLMNDPRMIEIFGSIGYGQGIRSVAGAVELAAGLALLHPATAIAGALLAIPTLAAAIGAHVFLLGDSPALASVLLLAAAAIAWVRRPE
ncbi:MAG: DoxX family protein, partial [Vicinamibacterales bacterium]